MFTVIAHIDDWIWSDKWYPIMNRIGYTDDRPIPTGFDSLWVVAWKLKTKEQALCAELTLRAFGVDQIEVIEHPETHEYVDEVIQ